MAEIIWKTKNKNIQKTFKPLRKTFDFNQNTYNKNMSSSSCATKRREKKTKQINASKKRPTKNSKET